MCQVAILHSVNYMQSAHPPQGLLSSDTAPALCPLSFLNLSYRSDM